MVAEEVGHVRSANKINCIFWMRAVSTCVFQDGGLRAEVAVKGRKYIVPSFPVIQVTLQEKDGALHVFDAIARDCDLLNHPMPAIVKL